MSVDMTFRQRLRVARHNVGLSQEAVAERLHRDGVHLGQSIIARIEAGTRKVTLGEAVVLARAVGMTVFPQPGPTASRIASVNWGNRRVAS